LKRWTYPYTPGAVETCCKISNRGLAILGDTLFLGTLDAHLIALDARTGTLRWNTKVAEAADPACRREVCYSITHAPLVVGNRVLVGVAGGDGPTRGFIAAFDTATGSELWRFHTVPSVEGPARATWAGDSWKSGGAGVWNTGTHDPELNLTYWGTGNPWPVRDGSSRLGDNLYSDSVVALDAASGALRWHYQFTPHDEMDWDSAHVPVLVDAVWRGQPRRLLVVANKNGLLYVLDRGTGEFLSGTPFAQVNWMSGFDNVGRPHRVPDKTTNDPTILPGFSATNWYPPSYSPSTRLFYVPAWEAGRSRERKQPFQPYGAVRAFDLVSGERRWEFKRDATVFSAGILTTASDLLFTGTWGGNPGGDVSLALQADGYFAALDARTGQLLWQRSLAGAVEGSPISYAVNGKQYIAVTAGSTLWAFALRR
jgi:alcohol dehydrogenase (cytochrome c)